MGDTNEAAETRRSSVNDRSVGPQRVAAVIACRDDRMTIASTVRACRAIPGVDLIVVVDDGSDDDTGAVARMAGAAVVRHSVPRGRASALETGVKVVAMRDRADWPARHVLFLDPDLGDSAVESSVLVDAVSGGIADCAIGTAEAQEVAAQKRWLRGAVKQLHSRLGWVMADPLATNRCVTREALMQVMPFHVGSAVDFAMTMDLIAAGEEVLEYPCAFERLPNSVKPKSSLWKAGRSDVWLVLQARRLKRLRGPKKNPVEN